MQVAEAVQVYRQWRNVRAMQREDREASLKAWMSRKRADDPAALGAGLPLGRNRLGQATPGDFVVDEDERAVQHIQAYEKYPDGSTRRANVNSTEERQQAKDAVVKAIAGRMLNNPEAMKALPAELEAADIVSAQGAQALIARGTSTVTGQPHSLRLMATSWPIHGFSHSPLVGRRRCVRGRNHENRTERPWQYLNLFYPWILRTPIGSGREPGICPPIPMNSSAW